LGPKAVALPTWALSHPCSYTLPTQGEI